jgi:microsomal dipeptidase-like Zn-dependent dipeptidase
MRRSGIFVSALAAALLLAGCGTSGPPTSQSEDESGANGVLPAGATPQTRYDLANGCYALKSLSAASHAARSGGAYAATAPSVADAEPFFMKPTALGKYLFYARDRSFLAIVGLAVGKASAPSEAADWTIDTDAAGDYTVFSASAGKSLAVAPGDGSLILADRASAGDAAKFGFDAATGCTAYPEARVDAEGPVFKGRGIDEPVLGFADSHLHISATHFLGGAHYGLPFHRFGIPEALKNCSGVHGPDGHLDVVGNFLDGAPTGSHDTVGWPTFVDWPARGSLMHESTYYKWIERTYRAGLRLIVNPLVENETLCNLQSKAPGQDPLQDCNEMDSAVKQAEFLRDMQDYIDAQNGGPGKGWFRIVDNPAAARSVINDGKLAVVIGIEISHLFNCNVTQLPGALDIDGCDQAEIDSQLDRLYDAGVREMFPIHEFDNALGGNGIFDGFVLNAGNFADTKQFWATYDCPTTDPTGNFADYFYVPGAIMTTSDPTGATNPLVQALLGPFGAVLPIYPQTRQCNARFLTPLGSYAFQQMMKKRIVIEVDHLELHVKDQLLDMAERQNPPYPVVSTHGGHGGISLEQVRRILAVGGILFPGNGNGRQFTATLQKLLALRSPDHFFGMGYGADANGLAHQADPRGAGATPVRYPFTLFQGPEWGAEFADVAPVTFERQVTGDRVFDNNEEGWAHYGLVADFVEEVRIEGGEPALDALYHSAEAYLQMWERTVDR